jgi:PAS domain S-box-containing protein
MSPPPVRLLEKVFSLGSVVVVAWRDETPDFPIDYASPNLQELLGIDPEELTSGRVSFTSLVHPDDLPGVIEAVATAISSGQPRCEIDDYRLRHADGHWVWVQEAAIIERDESGVPGPCLSYLVDITARRQAEVDLAQERDRLELVLEGTRLGMWEWNLKTGEVICDKRWAEMIGYDLSELSRDIATWESRVHPDDIAGCYADIGAHIDGKVDFYENVHRLRHRDGHWVHILDRGRIMERDADGHPTRFIGTHTDISPQRRAELEAREAERAKGAFLARMSHEIRTPLNGVLGMLQLLDGTPLDEQQREYLEVIRESGESLLTIIADVLDVSKIEAGEMRLDPQPFVVRRLLRSVADLYRERAITKGLDYRLDIDEEVPEVLVGDGHRLRQVLSNLTSNALKFTEAGTVTIHAGATRRGPEAELRIEVRDTGPGIADTDDIWEAFRQADVSISRKYGGTGLGLAISRQLMSLMGGDISVESEVGAWTVFEMRLVLPVGAAISRGSASTAATGELPSLRVLVAEDNRVNQLVIAGVLGRLEQEFVVVENGREAVERIERETFDLVLMDIHMPEMNGIEAARRIRALPPGRQPRVVAISADAFAPGQDLYREARFDGAVSKPFKLEDIARIIRECPGGGRKLDRAS